MNILDYAASVPTPADWTAAFQQAIADLRTRGGGTLIVPAGDYPTGAIRLYDNMTLHIESGAVLRFHQDASAFPLIDLEFEGIAGLAHQPCIYAEHAKNVTITGYGTAEGTQRYKISVWQKVAGGAQYVNDSTYYFKTDGQNYRCVISGLDPAASYRLTISYDSSRYYLYGGLKVEGIG